MFELPPFNFDYIFLCETENSKTLVTSFFFQRVRLSSTQHGGDLHFHHIMAPHLGVFKMTMCFS